MAALTAKAVGPCRIGIRGGAATTLLVSASSRASSFSNSSPAHSSCGAQSRSPSSRGPPRPKKPTVHFTEPSSTASGATAQLKPLLSNEMWSTSSESRRSPRPAGSRELGRRPGPPSPPRFVAGEGSRPARRSAPLPGNLGGIGASLPAGAASRLCLGASVAGDAAGAAAAAATRTGAAAHTRWAVVASGAGDSRLGRSFRSTAPGPPEDEEAGEAGGKLSADTGAAPTRIWRFRWRTSSAASASSLSRSNLSCSMRECSASSSCFRRRNSAARARACC
mmetsp:Transcript_127664/g.367394  ORF Transcript_127664/g.367394 Transcript_127664/m.367394 type:complete len:279 (+) Transcript_127664:561-1397(+)